MAVTWAASGITEGVSSSGKRTKQCFLNPTGTYTTGGDPLPMAALGLKGVTRLLQEGGTLSRPGLSARLAGTTEAPLIALDETNVTEVGSGVSITGRAFVAVVEGY